MKKLLLVLVLAMLMLLAVTLTASATKPIMIHGYFDKFVPGDPNADPPIPTTYCWHTGDEWGVPDGFMTGCAFAYITPGLGDKGTWEGEVDGKYGICEYNIKRYVDKFSLVVVTECTGELAGFHFLATGDATTALWEGSYHFEP